MTASSATHDAGDEGMPGKLQAEIQQTKPLGSLEEEAFLNVQRTANVLSQGMAELLKEHDLTQTQYNVLRILRGAGEKGLNAGDIAGRMITRDPDVTRLLDRLEKRGLVERWRCTEDRRVVWTRITPAGLEALAPLDAPVHALHVTQLKHLGRDRLTDLIELLEAAREVVEG
ncbi:MAG TPA: MarR family transcriptional regulator [Longimicrobium sp.]|nr:MarR family transcriptional regulator [Longimicrobium sp.]